MFEEGKVEILTTKDMYTVSEKDNIIVFLIDAFDAEIFECIQKKNPDIIENFKDFTYYPNIVGGATRTKYAIPFIFTGTTNKKEISYLQYLHEEFSKSDLVKALKMQKINSGIYTNGEYIDLKQTENLPKNYGDELASYGKVRLLKNNIYNNYEE